MLPSKPVRPLYISQITPQPVESQGAPAEAMAGKVGPDFVTVGRCKGRGGVEGVESVERAPRSMALLGSVHTRLSQRARARTLFRISAPVFVCLLVFTRLAWSWGRRAHEMINAHAVENLPEPLRSYFRERAGYLVEHSSDPDQLVADDPSERPHHFTDADADDTYPFPRLEQRFVRERRAPTAAERRNGDVIWQIETYTLRLPCDFKIKRWGVANQDAVFVAHYAADLTQPLHTVINYDGQLTHQAGIHARFETELVNALGDELKLAPHPASDVSELRSRIFQELVASYCARLAVFDADRRAVAGRSYLDPGFFPAFEKFAAPVADERMSAAVSFVSSLWYTAWVRAGRPPLPPPSKEEK